MSLLNWVAWWHNGCVLDLQSSSRWCNSWSSHNHVTTQCKLFTPICLCHHAV